MFPKGDRSEQRLVAGVVAGESRALDGFLAIASGAVWPVAVLVEGEGAGAEAAFLHVIEALKAHNFARLRSFDGRSGLRVFLVLTARDLLAERAARGFADAPEKAWGRFETMFGGDIRRRIRRRFPRSGEAQWADLYQEICLKLVEDNYRRIRAYGGQGSFTGFILATVHRLLIDLMRREAPRRRLPAEVERMAALEQAVFQAVVWDGVPRDARRVSEALARKVQPAPKQDAITVALDILAPIIAAALSAGPMEPVSLDGGGPDLASALADDAPTAEMRMVAAEDEAARSAFITAIRAAAAQLPDDDRLYLQLVLEADTPLPPREIARLMGRPVEAVYQLKQRTHRWLRQVAAELTNPAAVSV